VIQVDVHENYRTFDEPDEITYLTDFPCTLCGEVSQIYLDVNDILICKGCLEDSIKLLNETHLDHLVSRKRCKE